MNPDQNLAVVRIRAILYIQSTDRMPDPTEAHMSNTRAQMSPFDLLPFEVLCKVLKAECGDEGLFDPIRKCSQVSTGWKSAVFSFVTDVDLSEAPNDDETSPKISRKRFDDVMRCCGDRLQRLNVSWRSDIRVPPASSCPNLLALEARYCSFYQGAFVMPSTLTRLDLKGAIGWRRAGLKALRMCIALEDLNISFTKTNNVNALGALPRLKKLDISYTDVYCLAPLSRCTLLEELRCSNTRAIDLRGLPTSIRTIDVQHLFAFNNHLGDLVRMGVRNPDDEHATIMGQLRTLTALTDLRIDNMGYTPSHIVHFPNLLELRILNHWRYKDMVCSLRPITAACTKLRLLEVTDNDLYELDKLDAYCTCHLQTLNIRNTSLRCFNDLAPLRSLTSIDVSKTDITELGSLTSLSASLTSIVVSDTKIRDVGPLATIPKLRSLSIDRCTRLTALGSLNEDWGSRLEKLNMSELGYRGQDRLTNLRSLRELDASCNEIDDDWLIATVSGGKLARLDISRTSVTSVDRWAASCARLGWLNIAGAPRCTDIASLYSFAALRVVVVDKGQRTGDLPMRGINVVMN